MSLSRLPVALFMCGFLLESMGETPKLSNYSKWTSLGYTNVTQIKGLATLQGNLALLCDGPSRSNDAMSDYPGCRAVIVGADGGILSTIKTDLLAAQKLPDHRMVFLGKDLSLTLRESSGVEHLIASSAADPRVSEDGSQVLYTQFAGHVTQQQPGLEGKILSQNLTNGSLRPITDDVFASSPFAVPGSKDVLFLSGRTGLASIWVASPGKPDRQITNLGKTKVDKDFIPVFGRELLWLPGSRKAVFTATYGSHTLWLLDIDNGKARKIGPGRLPTLLDGHTIMASIDTPAAASNIVTYSLEVNP